LNAFSQMLTKITANTALIAGLDDNPGYDSHQYSDATNSRHGCSSTTSITEDEEIEINVAGDRDSRHVPQPVIKTSAPLHLEGR